MNKTLYSYIDTSVEDNMSSQQVEAGAMVRTPIESLGGKEQQDWTVFQVLLRVPRIR